MTDLAWINLGAAAIFGVLAIQHYSLFRKTRATLTREALPMLISQAGGVAAVGIVLRVGFYFETLYYAALAAYFGPAIIYVAKLPKPQPMPKSTTSL